MLQASEYLQQIALLNIYYITCFTSFIFILKGDGFDPNYRFPSHNHEAALHVAAAKGHLEIMSMLLQADANIDPTDEDHRTPLVRYEI